MSRVRRFDYYERVLHWVVGIFFTYLLLTGLALSHPRLFWITSVFGGGTTTRILHPWIGVIFSAGLGLMFLHWARDMRLDESDRVWLRAVRHYATRNKDQVPPAGKYNGGQKMFFWLMTLLGVAHLITGIPMWMPGGLGGVGPFYGDIVNAMRLLHYATTVGGGLLLIVHVYLGTVAYPGTLGAMIDGSVSEAWAEHHHPAWQPDNEESSEA